MGWYSNDLDERVIASIFKTLEIEKEIINKQVHLTRGHLEKLRRFKSVEETARE